MSLIFCYLCFKFFLFTQVWRFPDLCLLKRSSTTAPFQSAGGGNGSDPVKKDQNLLSLVHLGEGRGLKGIPVILFWAAGTPLLDPPTGQQSLL